MVGAIVRRSRLQAYVLWSEEKRNSGMKLGAYMGGIIFERKKHMYKVTTRSELELYLALILE